MTRPLYLAAFALGLAAPALAQAPVAVAEKPDETAAVEQAKEKETPPTAAEAPEPPAGFRLRQIDFGVSTVETDTSSSRFREYRSVPTGAVLPFVRFAGSEKFWYDVIGENVLQRDARYSVRATPGQFDIRAEYLRIPHGFGNEARSLLQDVGGGRLAVSDDLQRYFQGELEKRFPPGAGKPPINFTFLNGLVTPSLNGAARFDLALLREQGRIDVNLTKDKPIEIRLTYFHEKRRGDRASGTAFGFSNVVETPEPIDYRTQDFAILGEWKRSWGLLRGSVRYNQFTNAIPYQDFDNPFRFTDSTDPSAYTAPGSGSIGGASFARISLPPDSKSITGSLGFIVKFAGNSRLTTDATLGQWTQDDPFIAFTTNTAIVSPLRAADLSTLPARSLDGKVNVLSISSVLTSRPVSDLTLTARYRRYDLDNKTPRIEFHEGYVRFDAVWEEIPRISVPYGYTSDSLNLSANYDFGPVTVEGGYKYDKFQRTFRETRDTTQNAVYAAANLRAADWATLRVNAETGSRDFEHLEILESEEASRLEHAPPANLLALPADTRQSDGSPLCPPGTVCNLRFDQAKRDTDRYGALLQLSPGGNASITLSYLKAKDDYEETSFGLIEAHNEAFSADVDYTPSERVSVYGFYSRENISTFQRGRQSGATVSNRAIDNWTSDIDDKVDTFGGGATLGLVKDKVDLKLYGTYQRVDGNSDITSPVGGLPEVARRAIGGVAGIPLFDDTKIYTLSAELAYKVTNGWTLGVGGWYEQYRLRDSNTSDATGNVVLTNYVPGSFFLAAVDSDYKAHVLYVRASHTW